MIAPAPKNLTDDERAVWFEEEGAKPRGALLELSWVRYRLDSAAERIVLLEHTLKEAREWLEHDEGHGEDCNGCSVEDEIDEVLSTDGIENQGKSRDGDCADA